MTETLARRLASILDTTEMREVRAAHAAKAIADQGGYRWVGIYDVADEEIDLLGHSGAQAPAFLHSAIDGGLSGRAVRTRETVVGNDNAGSQIAVPILGAETGIVIGTLQVESDRANAFAEDDRLFLETCAQALMPLFE